MRQKPEALPCPSTPLLQVQYGNLNRKWWPLEHDALVVGRARGCDLILDSSEVSQVHCILARRANGWSIRDCTSRNGTRVNGEPVGEVRLMDGDVLKIGPFSFIAQLPEVAPSASGSRPGERNQAEVTTLNDEGPPRCQADLNRQADLLRDRLRECDQRAAQIEKVERELAEDRRTLDEEYAALQQRVEKAEHEIHQRQEEVDADLRRRWTEAERARDSLDGSKVILPNPADRTERP